MTTYDVWQIAGGYVITDKNQLTYLTIVKG